MCVCVCVMLRVSEKASGVGTGDGWKLPLLSIELTWYGRWLGLVLGLGVWQ